ncbi:MAG: hypothetical protein HC900_00305 [Methylacidiphilales bacterium]|nr:hypothetical protein [Candidatus Methylacidiphilales bacterium]
MPNTVIIFPENRRAEAEAYAAACDVVWQRDYEPGGICSYVRLDAFGQWVTPYYGPPYSWDGVNVISEPPELVPLRAEGVMHERPVWPEA